MRVIICLFFFLSSLSCFAQGDHSHEHINKVIGISDLLADFEIRIYKSYNITNCTEVFRMYRVNKDVWRGVFYEYYSAAPHANVKDHFTKRELQASGNLDIAWYKMLAQDILYLPQQEAIRYKLSKKYVECDPLDKRYDGYGLAVQTVAICDGTSFDIFIHEGDKQNHISYGNPESYLKRYPDVDELISIHGLLEIIRENFGVWKE